MLLDADAADNTSYGHTYEDAAIRQWLEVSSREPLTNMLLRKPTVIPHRDLRRQVEEWAARHDVELPEPQPYTLLVQRPEVPQHQTHQVLWCILVLPMT